MPTRRKRDRLLSLFQSRPKEKKDVSSQSTAVSKASSLAETNEPREEKTERLKETEDPSKKEAEEGLKNEETENNGPKKEEIESDRSKKETPGAKDLTTEDLWLRANKMVCERNPDLMAGYSQILSDTGNVDALATSQSVQVTVDRLNKSRQDKQWHLSLFGNNIKIREQAEKLVKFLLWTDDIVKAAVNGQPYAALAWTAVSVVLQLVDTSSGTHADIMAGFETICHVQMYWRICEEKYLQHMQHLPNADDFIQALSKVYASVLEYQAQAICHMSKRQLVRSWENATGSTDWTSLAQTVDTQSNQCKVYVEAAQKSAIDKSWTQQLEHMNEAQNILNDIRSLMKKHGDLLEQQYNDERGREVFQDLFSFYENDKNANPDIVPNTCGWFLHDEKFRQWRNSNEHGLLWVSAAPGCGKSVLSRYLIDAGLLSNRITTSIVCYFFFKDGIDDRSNAANALAAILHQLFSQDTSGKLIQLAYKKHKEQGKRITGSLQSLWEIFEACVQALDPAAELICILDALDECKTNSLNDLLRKLNNFYKWQDQTKKIKFLMTSRPFDYIETLFKGFCDQSFYGHVDADSHSDAISDEINLVIDSRLGEILDMNDASKYTDLAAHMKSTENRTYLWVHLALGFIQQDRFAFQRDPNNKERLASLPLDLDEQYERLLNRGQVGTWGKQMLELLLQMMLVAVRPLTLEEANSALTFAMAEEAEFPSYDALEQKQGNPEQFRSSINSFCGHFVNIHDSKLYFIHQTAREFLTSADTNDKFQWKGRFDVQEAQEMFSLVCMRFLGLLEPSMLLDTSWSSHSVKGFFDYATKHWMDHVSSQHEIGDVILQHARQLCHFDERFKETFLHLYCYRGFYKIWDSYQKRCYTPEDTRKTNLDVCLALYFGFPTVAKYIIEHDQVDMSQGEYLLHTTMSESQDMIKRLLDLTDQVRVTEQEILATTHAYAGFELLLLFQEARPDQTIMTDVLLSKFLSIGHYKSRYSFTIIDFAKTVFFEKRVLEKELRYRSARIISSSKAVRKLFHLQDGCIQITDAMVKAAASNPRNSLGLLRFFLDYFGDEVHITDDIVMSMLSTVSHQFENDPFLQVEDNEFLQFIQDYGNRFQIRQDMVEAVAAEMTIEIMVPILKFYENIQMTERFVRGIFSNYNCDYKMLGTLFDCRGDEIQITDAMLEPVAIDFWNGQGILEYLFNSERCKVTPFLVEASLKTEDLPDKTYMLSFLFEYSNHEDTVDKAIILAAESLELDGPVVTLSKIWRSPGGPEAIDKFATRDWSDQIDEWAE